METLATHIRVVATWYTHLACVFSIDEDVSSGKVTMDETLVGEVVHS